MTQAPARDASPPFLEADSSRPPPAADAPRERRLFLGLAALVALHVADDSFIQPQRAGHVGSRDARPREYEQRIIGFFDEALRKDKQ